MKAAVLHGREDVRVERVPVPEPGAGEVLVRMKAALTCGTDVKVFRRGYHARMIVPPALFGHELAGVVERVGVGVSEFAPGAAVVAANSAPCDACPECLRGRPSLCDDLLFWNGAYADLVRLPARVVAKNLLRIPDGLDFREAALVEPLACVVRGVEETGIEAGQTVAVIGVGPIGQLFVALARERGARVIAAGRRPDRLERAREAGAEQTIAAGAGDLADALRRASPDGRGPDVVVEAVGQQATCEAAVRAVRKGGVVNLFGGCAAGTEIRLDAQRFHYDELTLKATFHHTPAAIRTALALLADRRIDGRRFVTAEARLDEVPRVLAAMAADGQGLKTAIVPD